MKPHRISAHAWRIPAVLIALALPALPLHAAGNGPTPYPDPKNEAAWPGEGPIRLFGWMVDNRAWFWTQREAAQGAVVFAGDSLTGNWDAKLMASLFPGLKLANRGIGGDTSRGLLFRFREDVLDLHPRAVVLCIGTNDLSAHGDPAATGRNIAAMLDLARQSNPALPIVLCLTPPRDHPEAPTKPGAQADLNARIKKLGAGRERLVVLDLFTPLATPEGKPVAECFAKDRLHLAAPGYQKWAAALRLALASLGITFQPTPSPTPTATPTPTPTPDPRVPQTVTSPLGHTMTLKFHDEFDPVTDTDGKPYIDRTKWQTTFWQGSSQRTLWGNLEAQYYVDKNYAGDGKVKAEGRMNPFSFEKPGLLTISAWRVPEALWKKYWMGKERCFASGLLISDKRFTFQYGYVEGRFKLPNHRGAWPAFWLLGNDPSQPDEIKAHAWPPEIDIFEFFGHRPQKHSAGIIAAKGETLPWKFGYNEPGFDISKDFHTWGMEWNADAIVLTFDGRIWARSQTSASLRRPMYLLVNLAVGGKWYAEEMNAAGRKNCKPWEVDEATMPWKMECDYVRVYQGDAAAK